MESRMKGENQVISISSLVNIRRKLETRGGENANAAVAVIFKGAEGGLELLLVKRADVPGDPWAGDIAFPGGKRSPQDRDIMQTVLREVMEETSIDLESSNYLGKMEVLSSIVKPEYNILPMIFKQETEQDIKINEELTSYLWFPFNEIEGSRGRATVKNMEVPVFRVGGEVVWGLTYQIIEKLLEFSRQS